MQISFLFPHEVHVSMPGRSGKELRKKYFAVCVADRLFCFGCHWLKTDGHL